MTREIKFRAWDKTSNAMVNNTIDDWYLQSDGTPVSVNRDGEPERIYNYDLMQYTGLKDSNGKEIYEGDITTTEAGENEVVVFWEGCFCHRLNGKKGYIFDPKKIKIVGNVYENPELLYEGMFTGTIDL